MAKQISLDGMIKQTELVEFDEKAVYIGRSSELKIINLEDISSLSKTTICLNNRYFWKLEYSIVESHEFVEFRANNTLWNRNFPQFHALLTKINPDAVKTPYHWWYF